MELGSKAGDHKTIFPFCQDQGNLREITSRKEMDLFPPFWLFGKKACDKFMFFAGHRNRQKIHVPAMLEIPGGWFGPDFEGKR